MNTYKIGVIAGDGIGPEVIAEVAKQHPDVPTHSYLVDTASMFMVKDPTRFEVVVTSNLFGDILTDLGAAIAGGMGLADGANLNPQRHSPSMFEPSHGSALDIADQQRTNSLATCGLPARCWNFSDISSGQTD